MEVVGSHGRDPVAGRYAAGRSHPGWPASTESVPAVDVGPVEIAQVGPAPGTRSVAAGGLLRSIAGRSAAPPLASVTPQVALPHLAGPLARRAGISRSRWPCWARWQACNTGRLVRHALALSAVGRRGWVPWVARCLRWFWRAQPSGPTIARHQARGESAAPGADELQQRSTGRATAARARSHR